MSKPILIQARLRDRIHTLVPGVQNLQSPNTNGDTLHEEKNSSLTPSFPVTA